MGVSIGKNKNPSVQFKYSVPKREKKQGGEIEKCEKKLVMEKRSEKNVVEKENSQKGITLKRAVSYFDEDSEECESQLIEEEREKGWELRKLV